MESRAGGSDNRGQICGAPVEEAGPWVWDPVQAARALQGTVRGPAPSLAMLARFGIHPREGWEALELIQRWRPDHG